MKIIKNFFIISFYIILILYFLEIITKLFIKDKIDLTIKNMDQIRSEKIKKIPNFDKRKSFNAFQQEKTKNDIYPSFKLSINMIDKNNYLKNFFQTKLSQNKKIPFRGPINKLSLGNNEDGYREIIINDKYGFKNRNQVYEKEIDIMIIGDSFAEGVPFGNKHDVSEVINLSSNFNSTNYGVGGTGPLHSLGILREYGKYLKPKNVFYFFYEGNDLRDLSLEKNTFLISYLNNEFTQNLFNSSNDVEIFLDDFENMFFNILDEMVEKESSVNEISSHSNENNFFEVFKNIIELQNLKSILIPKDAFIYKNEKLDYKTFEETIIKMKENVEMWNGNFYLVYLPSWTRYNSDFLISGKFLKRKVLGIVKSNDINLIDMDAIFKENNLDNINSFNLGIYGHYTKKVYNFIAKKLIKKLD